MSLQDRLRLELRPIDARGHDWVEPLNRALAEAYRNRSPDDIAGVALLGAVKLDAAGRYAEALANLDFALSLVGGQSPQRVHLLSARAALLAIAGDLEGARVAIELAAAGPIEADRGQIELDVYRALVACLALTPGDGADHAAAIGTAERAGLDWLASGLTVWFVPWLAAFGERVRARSWLGVLTARAEAADHRGRAGDALALTIALDGVRARASTPDASSDCGPLEAWRLALARVRAAQLEGHAEHIDRAVEAHRDLVRGMNPGFHVQADGFAALVAAYRGREVEVPPAAPASFTLVTLPAQLAAAEAVALGGSVAACMTWSRALEERLPGGLVTALEWPASNDRIRGLLSSRVGSILAARAAFARAIVAMEACGFEVEAAITRVQAAEVESVAARRPSPATPRERANAAAALEALGLDPSRWAYPVSRALSGDRVTIRSDRLTPREVEVLRAFAEDLSYRAAGEHLGVSWRTVQSHATRAYRKLGVSGRAEAVAEAGRQHLIEPSR